MTTSAAPSLPTLSGETAWARSRRRMVTVPAFLFAAVLILAATPLLYPVALVADLARRTRFAAVRAVAMAQVFFVCEALGIFASGWLWVRHRGDRERFIEANYRLQDWWTTTLFRSGVRIFSLRVEVEGAETAAAGPILVFCRHVSPIDNLLPAVLIASRYHIRLRWALNRSLLRDPCLDIAGNRLPNCFVSGGTTDSEAEVRRVAALGQDLGPNDGVLLFPEGGLFSTARRTKLLARVEASGDAALAVQARALTNVLPPRLGGTLALLEAAPGVDAVFIAHRGMEFATEYRNILRGGLIGRRVEVRIWRVPAAAIPASREARIDWLFAQWGRVDRWVAAGIPAPGSADSDA